MREGSPEPTRPVWLTQADVDALDDLVDRLHDAAKVDPGLAACCRIIHRHEYAPDDATEEVAKIIAFGGMKWKDSGEFHREWCRKHARRVVAALGGSQETPT